MYENLTALILDAIDREMIERSQGPVLRRLITKRGWTASILATGLNPKGEDLYSICADYL